MAAKRKLESKGQDSTPGTRKTCSKVAIIVLNWNGWRDTIECLESLQRITYPNYQIIVVDNGSTDNSVERIKREFPHLTLIETGKNLGYAGGNNVGIKEALKKGVDYILILNNDTKVINPNFLTDLVQYSQEDKEAGIVGPMVFRRLNEIQKTILYFPSIKTLLRERFMPREIDYLQPQEAESLSGVCLLVKREVVEEVGLLDENYFMHNEETEWCYRVRMRGWTVKYLPVRSILHLGAQSSKRDPQKILILKRVNHIYTLTKHGFTLRATIIGIASILINTLRVILYKLRIYRPKEAYNLLYLKSLIREVAKKWKMGINVRD